jgi:hypothetical protein
MANVYSTSKHETKWNTINYKLWELGYWVKWQRDFFNDSHRYAIGRDGESKPMGVYEDEDTAMAMVKMLITNAEN